MPVQTIQYEAEVGAASNWTLTLADPNDAAVTTWTSAATLAVRASQGGSYPVAFAPTAAWLSAPAGTITLAIAAGLTSAIAPGLYLLDLSINGGGPRPIGTLRLTAAPGATPVPRTYCDLVDMVELASWIEYTEDLGSGLAAGLATNFLRQRAAATRFVDDVAMARARMALLSQQRSAGPGWYAFSGSQSSGSDMGSFYGQTNQPDNLIEAALKTIRAALDAGQLITDLSISGREVRRITAGHALYLTLRHLPGTVGRDGPTYIEMAESFRKESAALLFGTKLAIDTIGLGTATYLLSA